MYPFKKMGEKLVIEGARKLERKSEKTDCRERRSVFRYSLKLENSRHQPSKSRSE